ncbi:GNAT family N-acetyltransferase [Hahella ganghwensis]|uniref:GNAT family N-acetyltransferase n=1 Tax=Hahella ganghwensis TaxID=286420 RepID=UPI00036B33F8|nr:GNAT family N-acetyltransferase [Hahella ganghwensis]
MEQIEIDTVSGRDITPWLEDIAKLRLQVFREFPYLYEGSLDYESDYLKKYASSDKSVFILAKVNRKVVGAATGLPLIDADEEFQAPFKEHGLNISQYFYFGESVLDKNFRGRGIGHMFFDAREAFAWHNCFRWTTFCAVERPENHPQRPPNYRPLNQFWEARGYQQRPELNTCYSWQDIGEPEETSKPMIFWIKSPV